MELRDLVNPLFLKMFGARWLMSSESGDILLDRHVVPPVVVQILQREAFSSQCQTAIGLVAGESGAGKTFAVLKLLEEDEIGIYLRGPELNSQPAWRRWLQHDAGEVPLSDDEVKALRNAAVVSVVCSLVNRVMGAAALESLNKPTSGEKPRCFVVAIDEVGHCHQLVRALCSVRKQLTLTLSKALGGACVQLVAIGTGIDSNSAAPGSEPGTYFVEHIPANGALWAKIMSSLDAIGSSRAKFLTLLSGNSDAMAFVQNSRVASVMYENAMKLPPQLLESARMSTRCGKSVIPAFLLEVARRYKMLNGARECLPHHISRLHGDCARALLFLQRPHRLGKAASLVWMHWKPPWIISCTVTACSPTRPSGLSPIRLPPGL
jgi:hypothetical protein